MIDVRLRSGRIWFALISLPVLWSDLQVAAQTYPGVSILKTTTTAIPDIAPAASPVYSPEAGVSCPTPAISLAGYGANVGRWADLSGASGASSGIDDYGVVAGISIPLGNSLASYCRDYAKQLLQQQQEDLASRQINNQALLVSKCLALSGSVDFNSKAFDGPEFASLRDCRLLQGSLRTPVGQVPAIPQQVSGDGLRTRPKPNVQLFLPIR